MPPLALKKPWSDPMMHCVMFDAGLVEALFACFDAYLRDNGLCGRTGQIASWGDGGTMRGKDERGSSMFSWFRLSEPAA